MEVEAASLSEFVDTSIVDAPRRRRLRSVPAQAGPMPERGPAHPLALGRDAQARLRGAVRALLDAPGLECAPDAVRLAVIVLAGRTPSETGEVEIRTSELGRWLGLSASYVASTVVSRLRRSRVVSVETLPGEFGQDNGLRCRVLPLWAAHGVVGHPLALEKKELATLLRLLEAVMAPGWVHRDGRVTPAGLLGSRVGRGAATDRLALLLLALKVREDGRVRQCGGTVDAKRGRAAATVARLLGCKASTGERVLERLESRNLVVRVRVHTASGLHHRTRLVVPAVAAAHGRDGIAETRKVHLRPLEPDFSDPDVAVGGSEISDSEVDPQVSGATVPDEADTADPDFAATFHTDHSPMASPVSSLAVCHGFSGESRGRQGSRPEPAGAREDHALGVTAVDGLRLVDGKDGPLRGENRGDCADGASPTEGSGSRSRLTVVDGAHGRRQQQRVADLDDLRLRVALAPVAYLWSQLRGGQQALAVRAAERALGTLSGIVDPKAAPRVLAARLTDRLEEIGGVAHVRDPMGWLLGRGLVQRPVCPDLRCDDGIRLDTGADCPTCGTIVRTRRALRTQVAARVTEMPYRDPAGRRAQAERLLREETVLEEQRAQVRRAQAEREVEQRQQAIVRRRALEEEAELARRQAPCVDCGLPESAGLCPECSYRRRTDEFVQEAVDLAVAVRADPSDAVAVAELTHQCETDTRALLTLACKRACGPDADLAWAAFTAPQVAQQIRDERRAAALRRLLGSQEVVAEADAAYEACLRHRGRSAEEAADGAADAAGRRTAEFLLRQLLGELHATRRRAAAAPSMARGVSVDGA
ncbi:hypothetical protein ACWC0C_47030 [Streptomyces sp. NPDC001709]